MDFRLILYYLMNGFLSLITHMSVYSYAVSKNFVGLNEKYSDNDDLSV